MPGKPLIQVTATLSYLSPPFLTAIAFVYLFSPNAGLINVLMRDVLGPAVAHLQHLLDAGPRAGHGDAHLSVRLSAGIERAAVGRRLLRGGGANPRRRASCAPRSRSPRRWWRRRSCPARCSPSSTPSRCSARRRSSACPAASSRCRRASTRCSTIRRNTGSPRRCRCVFVVITVAALYLQRAFLARRSYVTLAGKGSRPQLMQLGAVALGAVRLRACSIFIVAIVAALLDADRGVVLEVLGPRFLEGPDARELQVHPVRVRRHPARDPQQPAAGDRRRDARGAARRDDRLDRSAHHAFPAASCSIMPRSFRSGCRAS